jgi:hypothetical protein
MLAQKIHSVGSTKQDPIRRTLSQKERDLNMTQSQRRDQFRLEFDALEAAMQDLVEEGIIVDSGQRKWSERTGRYEIVWKSLIFNETRH